MESAYTLLSSRSHTCKTNTYILFDVFSIACYFPGVNHFLAEISDWDPHFESFVSHYEITRIKKDNGNLILTVLFYHHIIISIVYLRNIFMALTMKFFHIAQGIIQRLIKWTSWYDTHLQWFFFWLVGFVSAYAI